MAKRVVTGTFLSLDATDYSAEIASAEMALTSDTVDTTNMGSGGWREFLSGLKSWTLSVDFVKDADLSGLDSAMWTAYSGGSTVAAIIRGTSGAASTSNAQYSGSILINNWSPLQGAVGERFGGSVTWQGTGTVTRATS